MYEQKYVGGLAKFYWQGGEVRAGRAGARGANMHEDAAVGDAQAIAGRLDAGESADQRDFEGQAPLHCAARAGQVAAVRLLLDCGAAAGTEDQAGRTVRP